MPRWKIAALGVLSFIPLACAVFVAVWPRWREQRWLDEFEREHGYDPRDPSLNWKEVPFVEDSSVSMWISLVAGTVVLVALAVAVAMIAYYARRAFRSETHNGGGKWAWMAALLIGNVVALPMAWYVFAWSRRAQGRPAGIATVQLS